jgi:hypothetical protein
MANTTRGSRTVTGTLATVVALVAFVVVWPAPVRSADPALPPAFERYLETVVRPSPGERHRLLGGEPVTKLLSSEATQQVAVFGAIWVNASMHRYVQAIRDIETWEQGKSFHITRRISSPPRLEDFNGLRLSPALVEDLRLCRVGSCEVKLDARTIEAFRTGIDWSSPTRHADAEALMRRFVFEYTTAYLTGGNRRLAVFRDKATPISMDTEFRAMVDDLPTLTSYMPNVRQYLLDYPQAWLPGATSFLYWQETEFGLKPTIRVSHLTIRETPEDVVITSKMIYANHYFRSALELRMLLPDPARGPGFWLVTVVSSRTDGMTGFTGLFVRRRVRSEAREGTGTVLLSTKRKLEAMR